MFPTLFHSNPFFAILLKIKQIKNQHSTSTVKLLKICIINTDDHLWADNVGSFFSPLITVSLFSPFDLFHAIPIFLISHKACCHCLFINIHLTLLLSISHISHKHTHTKAGSHQASRLSPLFFCPSSSWFLSVSLTLPLTRLGKTYNFLLVFSGQNKLLSCIIQTPQYKALWLLHQWRPIVGSNGDKKMNFLTVLQLPFLPCGRGGGRRRKCIHLKLYFSSAELFMSKKGQASSQYSLTEGKYRWSFLKHQWTKLQLCHRN